MKCGSCGRSVDETMFVHVLKAVLCMGCFGSYVRGAVVERDTLKAKVEELEKALHKSYENNVNYRVLRKDVARASGIDSMAITWDEHIEHIIVERGFLQGKVAELEERVDDYYEREGDCCPDDFKFDEYIESLIAKLTEAEAQRDDAVKQLEMVRDSTEKMKHKTEEMNRSVEYRVAAGGAFAKVLDILTTPTTPSGKSGEGEDSLTGPKNCKNPKCPWGKYKEDATDCCCIACVGMIEQDSVEEDDNEYEDCDCFDGNICSSCREGYIVDDEDDPPQTEKEAQHPQGKGG